MPPLRKSPMDRRRDVLIPLTILLIALGLRVWQLGAKSLWMDEATSIVFASRPLHAIVTDTKEVNPPLYYVLLHGQMKVFGTSEAALRMPSVVFGVVSVALIGWVGTLLGGRSLGLSAMALLAAMAMPLEYSQTARTYTLFLAATLASFGTLLMWVRERRLRWVAGYVVSTAVACYSHNYWVFTFAAQQLYLLGQVRTGRVTARAWVGLSASALLPCMPYLVVLGHRTATMQHEGFWIRRPHLVTFWHILQAYVAFPPSALTGLLTLGLAGVGWRAFRREISTAHERAATLLCWWVWCPLLIPFAMSKVSTPMFVPRYTIAVAPALALLMSRGILALPRRTWQAVCAAALVLITAHSLHRYYGWQQEDWRGAAAALEASVRPDDAVLVVVGRAAVFDYYSQGRVFYHSWPDREDKFARDFGDWPQVLQTQLAGHHRVWLVVRNRRSQAYQTLLSAIRRLHPEAAVVAEQVFQQQLAVVAIDLQPHAMPPTAAATRGQWCYLPTNVLAIGVVTLWNDGFNYQREFPQNLIVYGFELAPAQEAHG